MNNICTVFFLNRQTKKCLKVNKKKQRSSVDRGSMKKGSQRSRSVHFVFALCCRVCTTLALRLKLRTTTSSTDDHLE
jgi:hypothetical protein